MCLNLERPLPQLEGIFAERSLWKNPLEVGIESPVIKIFTWEFVLIPKQKWVFLYSCVYLFILKHIFYFIVPVFNNFDILKMVCEDLEGGTILSANIRKYVQRNGFYWLNHVVPIVIICNMRDYLNHSMLAVKLHVGRLFLIFAYQIWWRALLLVLPLE